MSNFFHDNEDLQFYLDRGIDWEPLVRLTEHGFQQEDGFKNTQEAVAFYREVLDLVGGFVGEEIAPQSAALDEAHPRLERGEVVYPEVAQALFEAIDEMELHGLTVPRELGGLNAPMLVFQIQNELFARADVSMCAHHGFHGGMAMAAIMFSVMEGSSRFDPALPGISHTRFQEVIDSIVAGEDFGSMDITEPSAGSDMGKLRCKGELTEEGAWVVTGQKMFITSGHGRWHFVIARTEPEGDPSDPFAGLAGLSMFIVPAYTRDEQGQIVRTHTSVDTVERKLGHNVSATVTISFDQAPAHLIGERGEGFKYMLMLMNNARVGVGFESLGLCEAAYRMAKAYAAERPSMGKTIDQHEMIADYLEEMRTDIQAIRCLSMAAGYKEELQQKIGLKLRFDPPTEAHEREALATQRRQLKRRARHLTPLLKYLASEKAVEMARRNVQIHGGFGYMKEYGAEKLLRDAVVMPIYEGTSQIQALMAMKDNLMAAVRRPRRFVREGAQARWRAVSARDPLERRLAKLQHIRHHAIRFLLSRLAGHKLKELRSQPVSRWRGALSAVDPKRDFALAMLHAERLTHILIDVAVAEELLAQAQRFPERRELVERWLERAEPRSRYALDVITTTGLRLLGELHPEASAVAAK